MSKKYTDKVSQQNINFELKPKTCSSLSRYLEEHSKPFAEFLDFYEQNFSMADSLRLINKAEREIGGITAVFDPELKEPGDKISHIKADFMFNYIRENLPFGYVEKTFKYGSGKNIAVYEGEIVEELQDFFNLGDKMSNTGYGVIYKGKNVNSLPEHVDIRDALEDILWVAAIDEGKKILDKFVKSKNNILLK